MDAPPPPPGNYNPPPPPDYTTSAPQQTNGLSVASLALSLVGLIPWFWFLQVPGLLGVIFGVTGRSQIAQSNGTQRGKGLAIAGLVIGAILLVLWAVLWVLLLNLMSKGYECEFEGLTTVSCVYLD